MLLFRVFPWDPRARVGRPGHALWISPRQGAGRIDNPDAYATLYLADQPAAAVAERLGRFAPWTDALLRHTIGPIGRTLALASFRLEGAAVLELDDSRTLVRRKLKPSDVATGDRTDTQRWAADVFAEGGWAGIRWWSPYEARWGALGLWDTADLEPLDVAPLTFDHPALLEAGERLGRR